MQGMFKNAIINEYYDISYRHWSININDKMMKNDCTERRNAMFTISYQ